MTGEIGSVVISINVILPHCQTVQARWQLADTPDLKESADEQCMQALETVDHWER